MNDLLLACQIIAGPGPCTVAVIAPTTGRLVADDPFPHLFNLGGLRHRIDIVALGRPGVTERFLYHIPGGQVATLLADQTDESDMPAARVRIFAADPSGSARRP
ncbi:hypothetical protein [Catellatospora sichuanensis]|uniref:hypothetical protein n=1 Tax=Catellatospora sichuanensis TaxID=1969805 RepID=UPI001181D78B|nr:hypothetical protein [Catellatospora sichuanensis]